MNFREKAKYNNSSLHWTIFPFVMGQLMSTILLLLCSPESASWEKTYFSVHKIKIPKSYNSLHGSSMYVRLTKIAFELQRHLVMITVHWKKELENVIHLFLFLSMCLSVILQFSAEQMCYDRNSSYSICFTYRNNKQMWLISWITLNKMEEWQKKSVSLTTDFNCKPNWNSFV